MQHDKDLALLAETRKVAVAEAKVRAIELAMEEQEIEERGEIPGIPHAKTKERTLDWIQSKRDPCLRNLKANSSQKLPRSKTRAVNLTGLI